MAAKLDSCIHSGGGIAPDRKLRRSCKGLFQKGFVRFKVAQVVRHPWQREQSSDKVYSLLCVDFPVGNNSPSRGV